MCNIGFLPPDFKSAFSSGCDNPAMRSYHLLLECSRPWLRIRSLIMITNFLSALKKKGESRSIIRDFFTNLPSAILLGRTRSSSKLFSIENHYLMSAYFFRISCHDIEFALSTSYSSQPRSCCLRVPFLIYCQAFNCPWHVFSASDEWINNFWETSLYSSVCWSLTYQLLIPNMYENSHSESALEIYFW
jgi:hypothetical protein